MDANLRLGYLMFILSFNPRARDGREPGTAGTKGLLSVSIHAPVMDAKRANEMQMSDASFNPRARDGRENLQNGRAETTSCFNPRARDGRESDLDSAYAAVSVSIHAPVMDANTITYR